MVVNSIVEMKITELSEDNANLTINKLTHWVRVSNLSTLERCWEVTRGQKIFKGRLIRVTYHQVYLHTRRKTPAMVNVDNVPAL